MDVAKLWGHQLLFKQGQKGHAIYSILSGSVQIWVHNECSQNEQIVRSEEEKDLGSLVTTLPMGVTFGEQSALVARQSSVTTGDGLTHLLVINQQEYESLLPAIQSKEALNKIYLLRLVMIDVPLVSVWTLKVIMYVTNFSTGKPVYFRPWTRHIW